MNAGMIYRSSISGAVPATCHPEGSPILVPFCMPNRRIVLPIWQIFLGRPQYFCSRLFGPDTTAQPDHGKQLSQAPPVLPTYWAVPFAGNRRPSPPTPHDVSCLSSASAARARSWTLGALVLRACLQACRPVFADFPRHQRCGLRDERAAVGDPPPLGVEHVLILVPALEIRVDRFGPRHKLVQLAAAAGTLVGHVDREVAHHVVDVRQRAVHIAGEGDQCCAALDPQTHL